MLLWTTTIIMIWSNYIFIGCFRKLIKILEKWVRWISSILETKDSWELLTRCKRLNKQDVSPYKGSRQSAWEDNHHRSSLSTPLHYKRNHQQLTEELCTFTYTNSRLPSWWCCLYWSTGNQGYSWPLIF